ncbi:HoxN/HupN/NixA family nickel/cobalt transporter [Phycicoccus flavus]|uniref:HoxN/HupN/NixA family nickel/cobalt transporter n=1 Tax=Phycicoccus flavus TaxID=2502783 RepID=UPI00197C6D05|nr:HoxN/HupN/NixA family nickel/cobalt transporter [Phycicoccus flavus]
MSTTTARWTSAERRTLAWMAAVVLVLNVVGWGVLLLVVAPAGYELGGAGVFGVGLGVTAFLLGARHAIDADHIAVIDNTTRKLVGEGKKALDTGFWFALGHSSVVFGLAFLIALGVRSLAGQVQDEDSALQGSLGLVGTAAAGVFLVLLGLMNLSALFGIVHAYRHWKAGSFDEDALEHHLHQRGLLARLFDRAVRRVDSPRHVYPVGLLMGLGFDTATQVALLVLAGGSAAYALPWYAVLVLPVLFAGGMLLFDSLDGVVMSHAYRWAFVDPGRKILYNGTVTLLSVLVALVIGGLLLLQLADEYLGVPGLGWVGSVDLEYAGFGLVAVFAIVWAGAFATFRLRGRRTATPHPS